MPQRVVSKSEFLVSYRLRLSREELVFVQCLNIPRDTTITNNKKEQEIAPANIVKG